ncbi:hypothetical protein OJF2_07340 [Aquisphaera giovannonii]|uniref:Uncharacterized protein n=1 Tax=Aquisphaera giovannonii TaxID=406548 RepID=A0A5B9VWV8_9BACT|nr:hypothetical protein [Aquisphaera giovannonii]QEH32265.1 hypothetical protein OJF2_07340 [Aquisphaera giovannonii]
MPQDEQPGDAPAELQFDRAEFATEASGPSPGAASDAEKAADGPRCAACKRPIEDAYYEAAGHVVCPACRERIGAVAAAGSPAWRASKAVAYGLVAAVMGSVLYYAIIAITGMNIGLVAIVVGALIGGAVRAASGNRGGLGYQALAVSLTYLAIGAMFIPMMVGAMQAAMEQRQDAPAAAGEVAQAGQAAPAAANPRAPENAWVMLGRLIAAHPPFLLVLGRVVLMAPVEMATASPISGLIYAFAIWEAWKLNRRRAGVAFSGPYRLAAAGVPDAEVKPEAHDEL